MIFKHFALVAWLVNMRYYLLVEALLVGDFSKWPPMNVVLMFCTFGEIKHGENGENCINSNNKSTQKHKQALMLN